MSWIAVAIAGGALISGVIGSDASRSAANTQSDAARYAADQQRQMFDIINKQNAPWRQAGQTALSGLLNADGTGINDEFTRKFTADDLKSNLAPNYQFMLDQGIGATKNAINASGGVFSGNALKGIADYAENYAGNAYQQAFTNWNAQQTNIFNRLSNIAGLGQTANQTTANAGNNSANAISGLITGGAAAQAAGTIGSASAIGGGINNALGWGAFYGGGKGVVPPNTASGGASIWAGAGYGEG